MPFQIFPVLSMTTNNEPSAAKNKYQQVQPVSKRQRGKPHSACIIWDSSCGKKGNCWFYDKHAFRKNLNLTAAVKRFQLMVFLLYDCQKVYKQNDKEVTRFSFKVDEEKF
ncbi:unnamed protein product, partial [Nesidiocoris tenuis]